MTRWRITLGLALFALSIMPAAGASVTVFAAASLKEAMDEQARQFEARTGDKVVVSYGASNALAKQIEAGAPADIFISADLDWMDYLDQRRLLAPGTRVDLLRNTLVLIAPASSTSTLKIGPGSGSPRRWAGEARHGQSRQRAGGQVRQERAREAGRLGRRREAGRPRRERARRAGAGVARRGAVRHRVRDRCLRRQGRADRRHVSARQPSADRLSRGASWRRASRRRHRPLLDYLRSAAARAGLGEIRLRRWRNSRCMDSARTRSASSR